MKEAMGWLDGRQEGERKQYRLVMVRSSHGDHGYGPTKSGASEVENRNAASIFPPQAWVI